MKIKSKKQDSYNFFHMASGGISSAKNSISTLVYSQNTRVVKFNMKNLLNHFSKTDNDYIKFGNGNTMGKEEAILFCVRKMKTDKIISDSDIPIKLKRKIVNFVTEQRKLWLIPNTCTTLKEAIQNFGDKTLFWIDNNSRSTGIIKLEKVLSKKEIALFN